MILFQYINKNYLFLNKMVKSTKLQNNKNVKINNVFGNSCAKSYEILPQKNKKFHER